MNSATLAALGLQITSLFKDIQNLETLSETGISLDRVAIEAQRFQLWAVNVGLFTADDHSLDSHICDKEQGEVIATLQRFLKGLRGSLSDTIEYASDIDVLSPVIADELELEFSEEDEAMADLLIEAIRDPIDRLYRIPAWLTPSLECVLSRVGNNDGSETKSNEDSAMPYLPRVVERDGASSSSFHTDLTTFFDEFRPQAQTPEEELDTDFNTEPEWCEIPETTKRSANGRPDLNQLRHIVAESPACFGPAPWSTAKSILEIIELSISSRGNAELGELLDDILIFVQRAITHDERPIDFRILGQIGTELGIHRHWILAEQVIRESLRIAKGIIRQPTPDLIHITINLANALSGSKKFDEAECLYRQCLMMCELNPQIMEPASRIVISNLARLLIQGRGYPPLEVVAVFKPICEVYLDGRVSDWRG